MALTEQQKEIALREAKEIPEFLWSENCGYESGVIEPQVIDFASRFLAALPKPEPVGNLNNGKFFWNTKGGPDKWRDRQNYDGPLYAEATITQIPHDLTELMEKTSNTEWVERAKEEKC